MPSTDDVRSLSGGERPMNAAVIWGRVSTPTPTVTRGIQTSRCDVIRGARGIYRATVSLWMTLVLLIQRPSHTTGAIHLG